MKVIRLIQGDPLDVSAMQACLKAELLPVNGRGVGRKSAEVVVLFRRTPAPTGRTELRRQGGATDDLGSSDFTPTGVDRSGARRHASPERRAPSHATWPGASRNRLVRSRMPGGVGRAGSNAGPYPISAYVCVDHENRPGLLSPVSLRKQKRAPDAQITCVCVESY